jgi:hypothetical protein
MTKLCLIGNSHLASLALVWRERAGGLAQIDAVFYGQHQEIWAESTAEAGALRCTSAKGDDISIDPQSYDAVVVVGCGFGLLTIVEEVYRQYHTRDLTSRHGQALSRRDFLDASFRAMRQSPSMHIADMLQTAKADRLFVVPNPLPSERGFADLEKKRMRAWRDCLANNDSDHLLNIYDAFCDELRQRGIVVIQQPEETKASPLSTRNEFSEGAQRGNSTQRKPDDYFHTNTRYGTLIWQKIQDLLARNELDRPAPAAGRGEVSSAHQDS